MRGRDHVIHDNEKVRAGRMRCSHGGRLNCVLCAVRIVRCSIFSYERSIGCKLHDGFNIYIDLCFNFHLCYGIGCYLGLFNGNRSERNAGHDCHVWSGAQYAGRRRERPREHVCEQIHAGNLHR